MLLEAVSPTTTIEPFGWITPALGKAIVLGKTVWTTPPFPKDGSRNEGLAAAGEAIASAAHAHAARAACFARPIRMTGLLGRGTRAASRARGAVSSGSCRALCGEVEGGRDRRESKVRLTAVRDDDLLAPPCTLHVPAEAVPELVGPDDGRRGRTHSRRGTSGHCGTILEPVPHSGDGGPAWGGSGWQSPMNSAVRGCPKWSDGAPALPR